MRSSNLVIVGREPTPRRRLDENKPEERRSLILAALEASGATIEHADAAEGSAALELAVTRGWGVGVVEAVLQVRARGASGLRAQGSAWSEVIVWRQRRVLTEASRTIR